MGTRVEYLPDGRRRFYVSSDALYAADMLDYEGAPELTGEEFEGLTDEMRKAREGDSERDA